MRAGALLAARALLLLLAFVHADGDPVTEILSDKYPTTGAIARVLSLSLTNSLPV